MLTLLRLQLPQPNSLPIGGIRLFAGDADAFNAFGSARHADNPITLGDGHTLLNQYGSAWNGGNGSRSSYKTYINNCKGRSRKRRHCAS
ncbi:MAG: hypothetical protein MUF87_13095 [Anaerolineae bacterium]|jgi:hypothetical protein|nr:hypothetical protein [Anaerolineae bacterium]